jgi:hypothetical protein
MDILKSREVCVMQNAETVLNVLRERGRRGLPCTEPVVSPRAGLP